MALTKVNTDLLEDGGKLDGIEAGADVTDTANVTAAGALMDSELTSEASVKALNQGVATGDSPTFVDVTATSLDISGNIDVDGTTNLDVVDIDGAVDMASTLQVDGAATIGAALASTNVQLILNGVASKAQRIAFNEGATNRWLLGQGAATETSAFELYNASGVMALSVDRTTNVATFASGAVFNEDGADRDFRVESDTIANALFVDGASGNVSIGSSTAYGTSKLSLFAATNPTTASSSAIQLSIGEASQNSSYSLKVGYINIGGGYSSSIQSIAGGNPTTLLLNADGGNVGIGTSNPVSQFAVGGAGRRIEFDGTSGVIRGFDRSASWAALDFEASAYTFDVSTARMMDISSSGVVINEDSADADFRVESNANAYMIRVDGGNNRIGFGLSNPAQSFAVQFATADRVGTFYDTGTNGNSMYNGAAVLGVSRSSNGSTSLNGPIFEVGRDNGLNATYNVSDSFLTVRSDSTVINEDSQDYDFRVESDTNANALFLDAGTDVLTLGYPASNGAFVDKNGTGLQVGPAGVDNLAGHMLMNQYALENTWMDICACHDANATGVLFLIHAVRTADQNRSYGALVRYAYSNAFNIMSVNQQNTTIAYRVSGDVLQYQFTSPGPYVVNLTIMAAG